MSGALIKREAIKRAAIVDAELGWPRGTCLGRLAMLYSCAQEGKGTNVAKKRVILEWACVEPEYAERFLQLCCSVSEDTDGDHIHFLEPRTGEKYFIVGNPEQLEKIATFKERASAAGIASGVARRKLASSSASSSSSSEHEEQLQTNPLPLPLPSPLPVPSPLPSPNAEAKTLSTVSTAPKPRRPTPLTYSEPDLAVGRAWLAYALSEMPWKEGDPKWTPEHFADAVAKVRRATDLNETGMAEVLRFVAKDEFWRKNACSPSGLLKRSSRNGERKIDNILVRLRTKDHRTNDALQQWAMEGQTNDQA